MSPHDTSEMAVPDALGAFRADFRAWLVDHLIERRADEDQARFLQRWHQVLFDGGWVGVTWPVEYGGRGLSGGYDVVINEEIGRADAPDAPRVGYMGRAFLTWGDERQRRTYLPGLLSGADYWCQGFSEPDAGSDLANVATRAELTNDHYVINGQKVWTTYGEYADYCLLLARTDTTTPKHKGISAFVLPMTTPGVEVRPIDAISGQSEFCEIFLTDVALPTANRIGAAGDGWAIAMMTVAYERGAADIGYLSKFGAVLNRLRVRLADGGDDPVVRRTLGDLLMRLTVLSQHVERRLEQRQEATAPPGPEMSVDKELMTRVDQALHSATLHILGTDVLSGPDRGDWLERYFYSRAASIYGGTEQIQLNVIAQRLLGLPR